MGLIQVEEDQYLELLGRASKADEQQEQIDLLETRIRRLEAPTCRSQKTRLKMLLNGIDDGLPLKKIFSLMQLDGTSPSKRSTRSKLKRSLMEDRDFKLFDHPRTLKLSVKVVTVNK